MSPSMTSDPHDTDRQASQSGPSVLRLFAGMVIAPLAWALQVLIGYALAAHACYPSDTALSAPLWPHLREIVGGVSVLLWLLLAAGVSIAWTNWQATRGHAAIGANDSVPTGHARARFMALCGLLVSALFAVVQLFTSVGILWIPACGP